MYNNGKQKSFLANFAWVGFMLGGIGVVFLAVAIIMQLVPLNPDSINYYVNGVQQPGTADTVKTFRLVFLLVFGIIGLALAVAGIIVAWRNAARGKFNRALKESGVSLVAQAVSVDTANVRANVRVNGYYGSYYSRLSCLYTASNGTKYIFKSGFLRVNPIPYLPDGKVTVYYDRDNMRRYFVDVDGSIGLGEKVVEM